MVLDLLRFRFCVPAYYTNHRHGHANFYGVANKGDEWGFLDNPDTWALGRHRLPAIFPLHTINIIDGLYVA